MQNTEQTAKPHVPSPTPTTTTDTISHKQLGFTA
jgi:hypothetical protein